MKGELGFVANRAVARYYDNRRVSDFCPVRFNSTDHAVDAAGRVIGDHLRAETVAAHKGWPQQKDDRSLGR